MLSAPAQAPQGGGARPLLLDHAAIAARVPHAGAMCLLHGVLECSPERILCVSRSQAAPDNPLRVNGMLPTLCGIEYAAQAMAVHGALTALEGERPRAGYLAALRDVRCARERLDEVHELSIEATRLMGEAASVVYEFKLLEAGSLLLSGRATVILDIDRK